MPMYDLKNNDSEKPIAEDPQELVWSRRNIAAPLTPSMVNKMLDPLRCCGFYQLLITKYWFFCLLSSGGM